MKKTVTRLIVAAAAAGVIVVAYDRLRPLKPAASKEPLKVAATAPEPPSAAAPAAAPAEVASAPAPPPRPAHMSATEEAGFDAWVIKTYLTCWKPAAQPADADPYVALVRVAFKPDGSLSKAKLVNPPSNPALKSQAKSVLAAVQACNPLQVPAQYRPFYDQWKTKTISFDPEVAAR